MAEIKEGKLMYTETDDDGNVTAEYELHPVVGQEKTQAEYDALSDEEKATGTYYIIDADTDQNPNNAGAVTYNNTNSGLEATNVQMAVDELASKSKTFGMLQVDISGESISLPHAGWYYSSLEISDKLPVGAIAFGVSLKSYDANVTIDIQLDPEYDRTFLSLRSPTSHTVEANRNVIVHYYV